MTRTLHYAAALALAAATLAGCTSEPAAAPTPASSASPSPSTISDGAACDAVVKVGNDLDFDPARNAAAGRLAAAASDRNIALAGQALVDAANGALAEPGPDANSEIMGAQLGVAQACADSFGRDGPWG